MKVPLSHWVGREVFQHLIGKEGFCLSVCCGFLHPRPLRLHCRVSVTHTCPLGPYVVVMWLRKCWSHPCGASGHNSDAHMYTFREPNSRHGQCFHWQADPKHIYSVGLLADKWSIGCRGVELCRKPDREYCSHLWLLLCF